MEENIPMSEDSPEPQTTSEIHNRIIQRMKNSGGFLLTWF